MSARFIVGDSLTVLRSMPENSVDLVLTSPPFLGLRSYLPDDHPDKNGELGNEGTPGAFLDKLADVVEACRRVLAPHGNLVVELGDTYSGSGGAGGDYNEGGLRDGQPRFIGSGKTARAAYGGGENRVGKDAHPDGFTGRRGHGTGGGAGWPDPKSMTLIPQSFAFMLAYGRNPLTGRETERWRVRNVRPWLRTNPPVGQLGGKWRPGTSYCIVACTSQRNYFDEIAIRDDRELVDWFIENGGGYPGAHYAVFPPELPARFVTPLCPSKVCRVCGEPSRRIVEHSEHDDKWRPGVVLDPFAGSGTTLAVATGHGRDAIGIDLDERNADLALERVGPMFCTVEHHEQGSLYA